MKKLLAILCTVAVLLGTVFTGMAVSAETPTLTRITVGREFDYSSGEGFVELGSSILNTTFEVKVTTTTLWESHFGFANSGWGRKTIHFFHAYPDTMALRVNSAGDNIWSCQTTGVDVAKPMEDAPVNQNATFILKVETFLVDTDNDGVKTDVQMNFYLNDTAYGEPAVFTDAKDEFAAYTYLYIMKTKLEPVEQAPVVPEEPETPEVPEDPEFVMPELSRITPANFTRYTTPGQNAGGNQQWFTSGTTFKNFTFEAYAKMYGGESNFRFCNAGDAWSGYGFWIADKTVTFRFEGGENTANIASKTLSQTFSNKTFFVKVNMACADLDGDGAEDDLKVWLWLDGENVFDGYEVIDSKMDYLNSTSCCMVYGAIGFYDPDAYTMSTFNDVADIDKVAKVLPSEMGFRNGTHTKPASGPYTAGDMGLTYNGDIYNKVFDIDVNFKNGGYLRYPMSATESGLELAVSGDNLIIKDWFMNTGLVEKGGDTIATITPETAGTALVYNDINVKIHVEKLSAMSEIAYEDPDNLEGELGEIVNDVRVTYYINNTQVYQNTFIGTSTYDVVTDEETGEKSFVITSTEGGIGLFDGKNKMLAITGTFNDATVDLPKLEKEYGPDKWGLEYQKFEASAGAVAWSFPVNQTFNTDIIIHEDAAVGDVLHLNNLGAIYLNSDGTLSYRDFLEIGNGRKLTRYDVRGKQMNLKFTLQSAVLDEDGLANDLVFGVWFDGKLAGNKYIYIKDKARAVQGYLTVYKGVEFIKPATNFDSKLAQVIPEDAGFPTGTKTLSGSGEHHKSYLKTGNFLDTVMTTYITFGDDLSESGSMNLYYGPSDTGIRSDFYGNGTFRLHNGYAAWFTGATYPSGEFKYQIAVEDAHADLNMDGVFNDIRIGIFIDDVLVNGTYYYFTTTSAAAGGTPEARNNAYRTSTSRFYYHDNGLTGTVTFRSDARELPTDYKVVTPADFSTSIQGTYYKDKVNTTDNMAPYSISNNPLVGSKLMQDKVFSAYIKAKGGSSNWLAFGHTGDAGIRIHLGATTASVSSHIGGTVAGTTTLPGFKPETLQKWDITFTRKGADMWLGFYIDGVLQNNSYIIIKGGNYANLYMFGYYTTDANAWTYIGNEDMQKLQKVDLNNDVYTVDPSKYVSVTINGEAVTETTDVTDYGDNVVVVTGAKSAVEKLIAIYVENDLTLDGNVNILDFIAMHKNVASEEGFTTHAAAAAAGKEKGDKCDALDIVALKKALLFA